MQDSLWSGRLATGAAAALPGRHMYSIAPCGPRPKKVRFSGGETLDQTGRSDHPTRHCFSSAWFGYLLLARAPLPTFGNPARPEASAHQATHPPWGHEKGGVWEGAALIRWQLCAVDTMYSHLPPCVSVGGQFISPPSSQSARTIGRPCRGGVDDPELRGQ